MFFTKVNINHLKVKMKKLKLFSKEDSKLILKQDKCYQTVIFFSKLRNNRFKQYKVFKNENYMHHTIDSLYESSRVLLFCALEWFLVLPLLDHKNSVHVYNLYKDILKEMIEKGHLQETHGWDNKYISTCITLWSQSPEPNWPSIIKLTPLELHLKMGHNQKSWLMLHPLIWGNYLVENMRKSKTKFKRIKRLGELIKCPYCINNEPCMRSNVEGVKCSLKEVKFRCFPDAGVHLCNACGHKILLKRFNKRTGQHGYDNKKKYLLNDGREIPHLGFLREFSCVLDDIEENEENKNINIPPPPPATLVFNLKKNIDDFIFGDSNRLIWNKNEQYLDSLNQKDEIEVWEPPKSTFT